MGAASMGLLLPASALADIPRVERIAKRVRPQLKAQFAAAGLAYPPRRVLLRVFKHERQLELWVARGKEDELTRLETFDVCAASGVLGPKRRQGDEQVPEGVYSIHRYNGWSGFHMSLRVDYPNPSDRVRGFRPSLGGAIMVHGGCASIGCVAIEDAAIERVFITALDGRRAGKTNPTIHMLPTRFDDEGWARLRAAAEKASEDEHGPRMTLWRELAEVDAAFEATHRIPAVAIDSDTGAYSVTRPPST